MVDDFNRAALAIEIDLNIMQRVLDKTVANRGYPLKMRMDNGPKLISLALAQWSEEHCVLLSPVNRYRMPLLNVLTGYAVLQISVLLSLSQLFYPLRTRLMTAHGSEFFHDKWN